MTDTPILCPYCKSSINHGASVCAQCGAFKQAQGLPVPQGMINMLLLVWLIIGPGFLMLGIFSKIDSPWTFIGIGLLFTITGTFSIIEARKTAQVKVWKRRR